MRLIKILYAFRDSYGNPYVAVSLGVASFALGAVLAAGTLNYLRHHNR